MDNLEPITRNEMFLNGDDLEPITREEMILAGADLEPITRHEWFLKRYRGGGGGGGYDLVNIPDLPANIASFNDGTDLPMASLKVTVTPYQDLHGYDGPWAGGAGKNKLPLTVESIKTASDKSTWNNNSITINGITYEIQVDTNGNVLGIKIDGTASRDSNLRIYDGDAEFYGKILNGCPSNGSINTYYMQLSNVTVGSDYDLGNGTAINQTDTGRWILIINIKSGTTVTNLTFKPMIRLATETDATFAPYSNICPIIGWDEAVVTVADDVESPTTSHEYTIDLDGTRYGGVVDATNGTMDDTLDYIASYNGETLPSTWISDRDVYAEGTTPTIGAEVVYTRATPITVQLAPTPVKSIEGENNISANCGQITEGKYFKRA